MQKLWQLNVDWDEPLDAAVREEWTAIMDDIRKLSELSTNRHQFKPSFSKSDVTLHVFADVSTKAYGAATFLMCSSEVSFVLAKNRIAPLKNWS